MVFENLSSKTKEGRFRIATVAAAALPAVGIFTFGGIWPTSSSTSGSVVNGRPSGPIFGLAWFIVTVCWFISWATAGLYMELNYLVGFWFINLAVLFLAVLWLYTYNSRGDKTTATQIMYAILFGAVVALIYATVADYLQPKNSEGTSSPRTITSLTLTPLVGWVFFASSLALVEINSQT